MKKGAAYTMFGSVEEYISSFPVPVQQVLKAVQKTVMSAAPKGNESISYGLPTVKQGGKVVVHYGAFQKHIGFYATPTGHAAFAAKLAPYKQGKGSVQFPLSAPMPLALIADIVKFRVSLLAQPESEKRKPVPALKSSGS
ncbi:MAG TPA: DUF1801 domain-containing protein [Flavisolibacter sp.]